MILPSACIKIYIFPKFQLIAVYLYFSFLLPRHFIRKAVSIFPQRFKNLPQNFPQKKQLFPQKSVDFFQQTVFSVRRKCPSRRRRTAKQLSDNFNHSVCHLSKIFLPHSLKLKRLPSFRFGKKFSPVVSAKILLLSKKKHRLSLACRRIRRAERIPVLSRTTQRLYLRFSLFFVPCFPFYENFSTILYKISFSTTALRFVVADHAR